MEWLAKLWTRLLDWFAPEQVAVFVPPRLTIELTPFNWLDDYGPHWEPGSTAFWLEPRRERDLAAWLRKYRPDFAGEFEAAGLSVVVEPLVREATAWRRYDGTTASTWGTYTGTIVQPVIPSPNEQMGRLLAQMDLQQAVLQQQAALSNAALLQQASMFNVGAQNQYRAQMQAPQNAQQLGLQGGLGLGFSRLFGGLL